MASSASSEGGFPRREFLAGGASAAAAAVLLGPSAAARVPNRRRRARRRVAVFGAGIGGLTAAHELALRGFEVTVFERKVLGGKSRSIPVPGTGSGGRADLPGEHGFRFFPGFYHHVPETMERIPYPGNENGVRGNLIDATTESLSREKYPDVVLYGAPPDVPPGEQTLNQFYRVVAGLSSQFTRIPPQESAFWARQIMIYVTSSPERRFGQWENTSWWDFVDGEGKSEEYRKMLAVGITRNLVAARADLASTRTIGSMAEAFVTNVLYRDQSQGEGHFDRVLDGPTNEVWIDPWIAHLRELGVRFNVGVSVERLHLRGGRIRSARVRDSQGSTEDVSANWFVCALPVERALPLWNAKIRAADPKLGEGEQLITDWMNGIQFYMDRQLPLVHGHYSFIDSPWALTALSQAQFWPEFDISSRYGDGSVRDVLSVDISDWDAPGVIYGRAAKELTAEQIAEEVWEQMARHLNKRDRSLVSRDMVRSWFLDPAIQFSAGGTTNEERLLVNTVGSWEHRPDAASAIPNLFLAADYVRTNIDLATMEGANEAGRAAVNSLLERAGSKADPVRMFHLFEHPEMAALRSLDAELYKQGQPPILETMWPTGTEWPLGTFGDSLPNAPMGGPGEAGEYPNPLPLPKLPVP